MSTKQSNTGNASNTKQNTFKAGQRPAQAQPRPIVCKNFNVNKLKITDFKSDGEYCKFQSMGFVKYDDKKCLIQTPWFNISQYGVSKLGDYVTTEEQRMTLKLPLDEQEGCVELGGTFGKIDKQLEKDKKVNIPQEILDDEDPADITTQFQYKPIVRTPQKLTPAKLKALQKKWAEEGKDWSKRKEKCNFWKAKLDVDYTTKKILTPIYVKDAENEAAPGVKHMVADADELLEYMPYGSKVRMVIELSRFYAEKSSKGEGQSLKFGIAMKIKQIESFPKISGGGGSTTLQEYAFVDENEDENAEANNEEETTNETAKDTTANEDGDDDNDAEDDDDEDSDDDDDDDDGEDEVETEKPVEPVKAAPTKPTPVVKPAAKPAAKPTPVKKPGK